MYSNWIGKAKSTQRYYGVRFACKKKKLVLYCSVKKVRKMSNNWIGAILAFAIGVMVATVSYSFSRYVLRKKPAQYAIMQIVRQWIQIAYLVVLFVTGKYLPWDTSWLLVGGCLGITLPMCWFTYQLVKLNDALSRKEESTDG